MHAQHRLVRAREGWVLCARLSTRTGRGRLATRLTREYRSRKGENAPSFVRL